MTGGMLFLVLALLVAVVFFMFKSLGPLTTRLSENMVTGHFQVAEALLDRDNLPARWRASILRMAQKGQVRRQLFQTVPWQNAAYAYLMKRIRATRKFFTTCPFVEDDETRKELLAEFDTIISRWAEQDVVTILQHYGIKADTSQ